MINSLQVLLFLAKRSFNHSNDDQNGTFRSETGRVKTLDVD